MEIAIVGNKSLRIKSRNTSFIVNPEKKLDDPVVILTEKSADYESFSDKLVIDGPGDYEVAGVSISATSTSGKLSFDFSEDSQKLLVLSSPLLARSAETEDYTATVVFLSESDGNYVTQIASQVIVIGNSKFLPQDSQIKKVDKVNLKKTEEYKGFIIHLSK